jgi:hypothetical protein
MKQMAFATGGHAFTSTNDLADVVGKAIDAGSNYYTIAYSPTNQEWKGAYRKIAVKMAQGGLKSSYRRGYFADDPTATVQHGETGATPPPYDPMHAAMMWGAPGATEIKFQATVRPSSAGEEDAVAPGNNSSAGVKGPFHRYTVSVVTNPGDMTCGPAVDGKHPGAFEFMTLVFDGEGNLVNSQGNGIKADLGDAAYASVMKDGILYKQEISVPVKGNYSLRIGVHDRSSGHVGAMEVPLAEVGKLAPVAAGAQR